MKQRAWLVALVCVGGIACGSSGDVPIGEQAKDGENTTGSPSSGADAATPATSGDAGTNPNPNPNDAGIQDSSTPDATCTAVFYLDSDGDGFGADATRITACTAPAGYVSTAGDCDDKNKAVHPSVMNHAEAPYTPSSGSPPNSFDYDCSGTETWDPLTFGAEKATVCQIATGGCAGQGHLPNPSRNLPPNADPYCGSMLYRTCRFVDGQCVPVDGQDQDRIVRCK